MLSVLISSYIGQTLYEEGNLNSVLGCGTGAEMLIGAPGFTIGYISFSANMAFATALSTSAITGGLGYSVKVAIDQKENWNSEAFTKANDYYAKKWFRNTKL